MDVQSTYQGVNWVIFGKGKLPQDSWMVEIGLHLFLCVSSINLFVVLDQTLLIHGKATVKPASMAILVCA